MSNIKHVAEELQVVRTDPVYQAHAYLTKVPVPAIIPFIEAYSHPGELIVDPFAGSGMTGVACAMLGRSARLFDISVLGRHIGKNYLNLVDGPTLEKYAQEVIVRAKGRIGNVYGLRCSSCGREATLAKTVWTVRVPCTGCGAPVNYYRALETANWQKADVACHACGQKVPRRSARIDEEPVFDSISCTCNPRQIEQPVTAAPEFDLDCIPYPRVQITPDRQMYKIQGLGKSGLTSISSFYSERNLAVLTAVHQEILSLDDTAVREKLLFAFTACLARASKRYQWSHQKPLNAANAYYYISPVFYEWNIYDLFRRKVEAILKADEKIRSTRQVYTGGDPAADHDVEYEISSAEHVPLEDNSADYIFTDPPFGSNLFYADMALFHEAWLGSFTEHAHEAVIDRGTTGHRSEARYESLLANSLSECRRILKPGRHVSMIFGNSSGRMWALLQRAIQDAHLSIIPEALVILNKGQRSVKGLASGFEHVATLDLVITMAASDSPPPPLRHVSKDQIIEATRCLAHAGNAPTPSHLYLELLRTGIRECWKLDELDLRTVTEFLISDGWEIETKTGKLHKVSAGAAAVGDDAVPHAAVEDFGR